MNESRLPAYRRWAETALSVPPTYSVVIPAYNESERIVPTIGAIAYHLSSLGEPWELIVADDGSTDNTVELVRQLALANLRVLVTDQNQGKGSAVRRGVFAARGSIVLFADADQSTPIEQFATLLQAIEQGADVAIGSRSTAGSTVQNKSALRSLLSGGLNKVVRVALGMPFADTQCGFKMFTAPAAQALFMHQVVDGFSFDLEVLYLAENHLNLKVAEVPVDWVDAPGSTVETGKVAFRFLLDVVTIRARHLLGRYRLPAHSLDEANAMTLERAIAS